MAPRIDERVDRVEADVVVVRERLTRVETAMAAHESAAAGRHTELIATVREMKERLERADNRAWKLALVVLAIGLSGGAGVAEWVRTWL